MQYMIHCHIVIISYFKNDHTSKLLFLGGHWPLMLKYNLGGGKVDCVVFSWSHKLTSAKLSVAGVTTSI